MYDKKFDNVLRPLARSKKSPEELLEMDGVSECWKAIAAKRENELNEEAVRAKAQQQEQEQPEPSVLATMRKPAASFTENSDAYWLSLANKLQCRGPWSNPP